MFFETTVVKLLSAEGEVTTSLLEEVFKLNRVFVEKIWILKIVSGLANN